MRTDNLYSLPENLSVPQDDGACDHLRRSMLPASGLRATSGVTVDLSKEGRPWLVVYCYPRTGRPDKEPPGGMAAWNAIPGHVVVRRSPVPVATTTPSLPPLAQRYTA